METENFNKMYDKKIVVSLLGISVMLFSIVGVTTILKKGYNMVARIVNHSVEKENFEKYILPVLMFDPVPFDDISTVSECTILQSAIWATFFNNSKDKYLNQEYNSYIVPSSDVDVNLVALYGNDVKVNHQTFTDEFMNTYVYDDNTHTYTIPVYAQVGLYSPQVKDISKNKDVYVLTVGYIRPSDVWQTYIDKTTKVKLEKYMEYVLKKTEKGYNIISIKDVLLEDDL